MNILVINIYDNPQIFVPFLVDFEHSNTSILVTCSNLIKLLTSQTCLKVPKSVCTWKELYRFWGTLQPVMPDVGPLKTHVIPNNKPVTLCQLNLCHLIQNIRKHRSLPWCKCWLPSFNKTVMNLTVVNIIYMMAMYMMIFIKPSCMMHVCW